jgi:hypothetical protein
VDLTRDIVYRGYTLNDENIQGTVTPDRTSGAGITGCVVNAVDVGDVDVIQYREPKSQQDGIDVGEPQLGSRRIHVSGTLYAASRLLLYDELQDLRAALNPRLAYLDEPADKGYQPLYFSVPTTDTTDWPTGAKDMLVNVMPYRFRYTILRDNIGGTDDEYAGAISWEATFMARDPRFYADQYASEAFTGSESGTLVNRGDFPTNINIILATNSSSGSVFFSVGGSLMNITVPASTGSRTFRYKGDDRILTVEEAGVEQLRMDLLSLNSHPQLTPGSSAYSITKSGSVTLSAGTMLWYWEAFA